LNLDSGAGSYDHEDSVMDVYVEPHCRPGHAAAVLAGTVRAWCAREGKPERFRLNRYSLAGDNFLCDPRIGVPNPWLAMGDGGDFWHNTGDTPDRVDPRSLAALSAIVGAYAWFMASASTAEIGAFAAQVR